MTLNKENSDCNNQLNDLSGSKWLYSTRSVIKTDYKKNYNFELRKNHGANKPPDFMKELIEFFTKSGQIVFDPFAGVGGTLIGASLCDRKGFGIEINKKWADLYKEVCCKSNLKEHKIIIGDCLEKMGHLIENNYCFDLILTDPPYGPNLKRTMCNGKYDTRNRKTNFHNFSSEENDFSNCTSFDDYFKKMDAFLNLSYKLLKYNKYLLIIIKNSYQDGRYIQTNSKLAEMGECQGFTLKGEIIWHQNGVRLRPYGYPFVYVPNIIHHNILILRKEG